MSVNRIHIFHIGKQCAHISRMVKMIGRYYQDVMGVGQPPLLHQTWANSSHVVPNDSADVVIIHDFINNMDLLDLVRGRQVAWIWDSEPYEGFRQPTKEFRTAIGKCDLVLGPQNSTIEHYVDVYRWLPHKPLVDSQIFIPETGERTNKLFVARNKIYQDVVKRAFANDSTVLWAGGTFSPEEMASSYRKSLATLALGESPSPNYCVVEACLSGSIPIVSNTDASRRYFEDGGAVLVDPTVEFLQNAVQNVIAMPEEKRNAWRQRNYDMFHSWTMESQALRIVRKIVNLALVSSGR